jgi:hypothetical protein
MAVDKQTVSLPSAADESEIRTRIEAVETLLRDRYEHSALDGLISDLDALQWLLDDAVIGKLGILGRY